tara:strand:+ start:377 stop:1723 length:1347 start_codon:yes stop_codon:yes gene_type:complete
MIKPFMLIQAPVNTRSGYGSHSRDVVRSLIKMDKWDIKIVSLNWGNTPMNVLNKNNPDDKIILDRVMKNPKLDRQPDIGVEIRVPNEFQAIAKYNIGITAGMETNMISVPWVEGINRVDLCITTSTTSKEGIIRSNWQKKNNQTNQVEGEIKVQKPIEILFEGVDDSVYKETKNIPTELDDILNDIPEKFNYLYFGHWLQGRLGEDRKDTGMLVKTFLETFKGKEDPPGLILKTSGATFSIMDREDILNKIENIKKQVGGDDLPNIYVLHGELTREEVNGLYNHPKVKTMISFTHGEGFGRPLLEFSVSSRKPIIVSGWGGQTDFLDKNLSVLLPGELKQVGKSAVWKDVILPESSWFYVNYKYASRVFEEVYKNYNKFKINSKKQSKINKNKFTLDKMYDELENILLKYLPEFSQPVELKLPKLKKVGSSVSNNEMQKIKLPKLKKV